MLWHLSLLHQQPYPQLNLPTLLDLLAPLPSRMVGLIPQSPQLRVVRPPSRLLPLHPLRLLLYRQPLRSLLSQSLIRRASQGSSKVPPPYRLLHLMLLPPPHVPPLYLPKPIKVSRTRPPSRRILYARAKMVILPPHGPPSTRVPCQMAKTIVSVSVDDRKLVLAVLVLVPRLRLCLVRE
jgi:hypothetical protein